MTKHVNELIASFEEKLKILEDAVTHGLFLSEVEEQYKVEYFTYLRSIGRFDLIDSEEI